MKLNWSLFLFFLVFIFAFKASDPAFQKLQKEVKEINARLDKCNAYTMKTEYKVFRSQSNIPMEKNTGLTVKNGVLFFQKLDGFLTIQNEKLRLMVDDSNQVILLTNPLIQEKTNQKVDLQKALSQASEISISKDNGDELMAKLLFPKGKGLDFSAIDFSINKKKKIIDHIFIHYLPKMEFSIDERTPLTGRMEMHITSFEPNTIDPTVSFSTDSFVKQNESGQWMLQKKYSRYQLINQLSK